MSDYDFDAHWFSDIYSGFCLVSRLQGGARYDLNASINKPLTVDPDQEKLAEINRRLKNQEMLREININKDES